MKKLLIIPLAVLGFFLFTGTASAATLFSWTSSTATLSFNAGGEFYTNGSGGGCSSTCTISTSGTLSTVTLKFKSHASPGALTITLLDDLGASTGCTATANTSGLTDGDTFVATFTGAAGTCDVTATDIFGIQLNSVNGAALHLYSGADGSVAGKVYQVWQTAAVAPSISFVSPTDGTTIPDFGFWVLNLTGAEANDVVTVLYFGADLDTVVYSDEYTWQPTMESSGFLLPKSNALYQPPNVVGADWVAQAYLYDSDGTLIDTSGYIGFTVNAEAEFTIVPESITDFGNDPIFDVFASSTLNCGQYEFIDTYIGGTVPFFASTSANRVSCEIMETTGDVLRFAFIPPASSTQNFANTLSSFKQVVPFSIYFSVMDSIRDGAATSTGSGTLSVNLPGWDATDTYESVAVISSTTLTGPLTNAACDSECAGDIKSGFDTWITRIIWGIASIAAIGIVMQ